MDHTEAVDLARRSHQGTLATIRRDGRPQLSSVLHVVDDHGTARVSTLPGRAKAANLRRSPWAALHVRGPDFWSYAVVEGPVELTEPVTHRDDAVMAELRDHYRAVQGEPEDWTAFEDLMLEERRIVVRLRVQHAYGFRLPS
ncbi:PPOX class F420-dependent oxidoreductase [Nocardioides sp. SYSU D00038]|uniref:PPOX class F420-dependent oxidoreductase n=1 Tax=Nocardioides sp. SYSU D00038 TaxID=2812554 RepID=UPI001966D691|nr:PPOX class F420-dependent oxidoreductase [Nocardioides sp. SYSU D00038]